MSQGTLRRVAAEVEVLVKEMTATLKAKVVAHSPAAVECIAVIRRLGGPVADLQVDLWHTLIEPLLAHGTSM